MKKDFGIKKRETPLLTTSLLLLLPDGPFPVAVKFHPVVYTDIALREIARPSDKADILTRLSPDHPRARSILEKAGLSQIRFHDLRHSFASWLIANGESLVYVKEQMGHRSIQITVDSYGHLIPGANRQAVNRLAAMVENPQPIRNREEKRGQAKPPNPLKRLVGHAGIEPATS